MPSDPWRETGQPNAFGRGTMIYPDPKTGDPVSIPAKRVPYFKPGKELKELINEENSHASATSPSRPISDDTHRPPIL